MKPSGSLKINTISTGVIVFVLTLFLNFPSGLQAQEAQDNSTRVVSDQMVAQRDTGIVEFKGNVKVTRKDGIITSDSLKIYFDEARSQEEADQNRIKKIVAAGNVEFTSGTRRAVSDKAVYTMEDEILILTGSAPRLWTGKNFVSGKKITLFRKTDRAMVESDGNSRVEAFFDPNDKESKKLRNQN